MHPKLLLLLSCALITACATAEFANSKMHFTRVDQTTVDYDDEIDTDNEAATNIKRPTASCNVLVNSITDKRHSRKSFGTSYRYEKFALHVPEWVEAGLLSIKPHHLYMQQATTVENKILMDIEILKAYMHHRATSLNANVVLRVKYRLDNKNQSKIYRGMDTSLNWAGATNEVEDSMNIAISKVLDEITADISNQCIRLR